MMMVKSARTVKMQSHSSKNFIIKEIKGKGKGMIAVKTIKQGKIIYSEKPLLSINRNKSSSLSKDIETQFSKLNKLDQELFLNLSYRNNGSKEDIFCTNAIANTPKGNNNEILSHVFPIICRANHSCWSNSHFIWNNKLQKEELIAIFDIKCGEEITVHYLGMNSMLCKLIRTQLLSKNWGFACECILCKQNDDHQMSHNNVIKNRQIIIQKSKKLNMESYAYCIKGSNLVKQQLDSHPLYLFQHNFQALKCCVNESEKHNDCELKNKIRLHKENVLKYYYLYMGKNSSLPYNVQYWINK